MAYTDTTKISNFLQRALNAYETAEAPDLIAAVKIWLDKKLNSTFDQATPTTRYYDGGVKNLDIDPCTAITKVEAVQDDGADSYEYTVTTEYIAEPRNETVKRELRKRLGRFPHGLQRVAVTATFSEYDGSVPSDIQIAATRLAVGLMNAGRIAKQGGNIKSESLEGHSITYQDSTSTLEGIAAGDPIVSEILASRAELYVDNDDPDLRRDYDDGDGLLL